MDIKSFINDITTGVVVFNSIQESEVLEFRDNLKKETEELKLEYLSKIIEETNENELLISNYKTFFEDEEIRTLLKKIL